MTSAAQPPLASVRQAAGLTQAELAELVGVHRVMIAKYETGTAPNVYMAMRIAQALGVPVETAFFDREPNCERD